MNQSYHKTDYEKISVVFIGPFNEVNIYKLIEENKVHELIIIDINDNDFKFNESFKDKIKFHRIRNYAEIAELLLKYDLFFKKFKILSDKSLWYSNKNIYQEMNWFLTFRTQDSFSLAASIYGFKNDNEIEQNSLISLKQVESKRDNLLLKVLQELMV